MKRIPAFVLFTILLVNAAGFYVYYFLTLQRIHWEMRAKLKTLPDEELTRLVLSNEDYRKSLVEEDEIKVNGKMFDVGRIQVLKDSVIVFVVYDEKEDDLLALVNEIISKPFDKDPGVTGSVLQFITLVFLPGQNVGNFLGNGHIVKHDSVYFISITDSVLRHEAPPPRNAA